MVYQYTSSNLIENPTHYMYSSFEGLSFIEEFKKSRKLFLENSIIPNLDVRYDLNPFMNDIHSALSAYLTSPVTDFELLDLSLEVPEIDIEDTIITENLINYLIGSSLSPVKNNNHHLDYIGLLHI